MLTNTKIYFICPDTKQPIGGIKQLYRQVDILNKNGFNASILHKKRGFRCNWFFNQTQIEYNSAFFRELKFTRQSKRLSNWDYLIKKLYLSFLKLINKSIEKQSILVFPEIYGPNINSIESNVSKVIFNQNCYYTFQHFPLDTAKKNNPYTNSNTLATIVASEDAKNYLSYVFPYSSLYRMRLGIDSNNFFYSNNKKRQIAFMPRKLGEDVVQVINILKQRNALAGWDLISIENKSEAEVAAIMRDSYIYLSFNNVEGFGLPPAEAMACGCIVIGYQGRGGQEYFKEDFSYPIEDRDIIGFVQKVEAVIKEFDANEEDFIKKGLKASSFILQEYSMKNEENDIVHIWSEILKNQKNDREFSNNKYT